jgi:hypothetical protein
MHSNTLSKNSIDPGIAWLTIGTVEQIRYFFKEDNISYTYLVYPTTKEIRECFKEDIFDDKTKVVIIIPAVLQGSGVIKDITKRSKGGDKSDDNEHSLPSDQFFIIPEDTYCFVVCADLCGDISKSNKAKIKSIEGGQYKILDLSSKDRFPLSGDTIIDTQCRDNSIELINSLTTKIGYSEWSQFNRSRFFYHFLIPGFRFTPIFARSNSLSLIVWTQPFIQYIERNNSLSNPREIMGLFAYWVYCAVTYWGSYWGRKLDSKKKEYLIFIVSDKARLEWHRLTSDIAIANKENKKG